ELPARPWPRPRRLPHGTTARSRRRHGHGRRRPAAGHQGHRGAPRPDPASGFVNAWKRTLVKLLALFVLPCSIITGYLYFAIGNIQSFKIGPFNLLTNEYTLTAVFDDVNGMLPNDNVKIAGVVVGKVTTVKVLDGRALVTFKVH